MADGRRAVLIAGPTASGKSALALEYAEKNAAMIVNADSMQVYDVLNVLTARPPAVDLAQAAHRLYGFVAPDIRFSTGGWQSAVSSLLREYPGQRDFVFAGGTGLYFEALTAGISSIPEVPAQVVVQVEAEVASLNRAERKALIAARDPQMANVLAEPDRQRLVRALSVLDATGRSLAEWQAEKQVGLLNEWEVERIVLSPDRDVLRERISSRFVKMLEHGSVDEVKEILALKLDPSLPAMKAIGVRQIAEWLEGRISKELAIERSIIATHQYAKRQRTWFRGRMASWEWRE